MLRTLTDDLGRTVSYPFPPQRVVSLCPSQTETLWALGTPLVGRTKFCIHPAAMAQHVPEIGGTKKVRLHDVLALQPDIIIAEQEEQTPELVHELEAHGLPVFVTKVETVAQATNGIRTLGDVVARAEQAQHMAANIERAWNSMRGATPRQMNVVYLIWRGPWMAVGPHTFIDNVLQHVGLENAMGTASSRYPETSLTALANLAPELVLLSSEPFPFNETHVHEVQQALPTANVELVDGEMFSWYGVRMQRAAHYLQQQVRLW